MGGHIRVKARFQVDEDQRAEARHEKAKEDPVQEAYDELRVGALSFEQIAEANVEAMLNWKLGPIFDPEHFYEALRERHVTVVKEWLTTPGTDMTPGSTITRYLAFATRESQARALVERFPALHERAGEFKASTELRSMPTLRYPALLRAALASDPTKRKATPSDGYDIDHLTLGLSRCDIATADRAMTRLLGSVDTRRARHVRAAGHASHRSTVPKPRGHPRRRFPGTAASSHWSTRTVWESSACTAFSWRWASSPSGSRPPAIG